jgi:hypothetical protein
MVYLLDVYSNSPRGLGDVLQPKLPSCPSSWYACKTNLAAEPLADWELEREQLLDLL